MAIQPSIHWINNQTRLNAQNMNTIGNAIDEIGFELYGDNNNGLVNTVEVHNGWFIGDPQVNNSGVFTQLRQLGQALLTPTYNTTTNQVWASGTYNYNDILTHPTAIPDTENTADWNTGHSVAIDPVELRLFSNSGELQRSVLGAPSAADNVGESYVDALARTIRWNYTRLTDIGSIYRREGIYFNNDANTAPYIRADKESGRYSGLRMLTPSIRIAPNNDIDGNVYLTASESLTTLGSASSAVQIGKSNLLKVDNTSNEVYSTTFLPMYNTSTIGSASLPWESIRSINHHVNNLDVNTKAVIAKLEVTNTTLLKDKVTIEKNGLSVTGDTDVTGAITTNDNLEVAKQANIQTLVANTADIKDAEGNYIQGTNLSSVVVYKTLKDEETRALAAEKVLTDNLAKEVQDRIDDVNAEQHRAETAELKLTNDLASETANRIKADNEVTAAYKKADSDLETKIIGNADDTVEDNTLNGVINYAVAEDEKITAAYTAKDSELQGKIDAINIALSYLADKNVIVSNPDFQYTSSTNIGTVEVGTELTPKYQLQFTAGQYEYGPNPTGVTATSYKVTFNNETLETASGTFSTTVHVTDDMSLTLSAVCKYSDGAVPKNNLGLDYADGKIVSKTVTRQRTLKGYRQAFAGGLSSKDTAIAELDIRGLSGKGATTKVFDVEIDKNATRVVVAFPNSWGTLKSALDVNDSSKNIVTSFGTPEVVSVSGVTAGEDLMDYKVYVMDFASAYGGSGNTYKITIG